MQYTLLVSAQNVHPSISAHNVHTSISAQNVHTSISATLENKRFYSSNSMG